MKTNATLKSALVALCCGLALTACHNDDEPGVDLSKPITLSFSPAQMGAESRATIAVTDAAFGQGDRVGVYTDAGYNNVLYTNTGGTNWQASTSMYWPDASTYTFRAYYPYQESVTDVAAVPVTLPADQSDADKLTAIDYMWASTTQAASDGPINMELNHKMSLLKLDVTDGEGFSLSEIKNMDATILGTIPSEGTWNLTTGTVAATAGGQSHNSIVPYMVENNGTSLTYYALVMPGTTFAEHSRFFQLTDGGTTYSYVLNIPGGIKAVESQYCNISLTVDRSGITMGTFTVGDWTPGQSGSGEVTMD